MVAVPLVAKPVVTVAMPPGLGRGEVVGKTVVAVPPVAKPVVAVPPGPGRGPCILLVKFLKANQWLISPVLGRSACPTAATWSARGR